MTLPNSRCSYSRLEGDLPKVLTRPEFGYHTPIFGLHRHLCVYVLRRFCCVKPNFKWLLHSQSHTYTPLQTNLVSVHFDYFDLRSKHLCGSQRSELDSKGACLTKSKSAYLTKVSSRSYERCVSIYPWKFALVL